jgi:hypothetical protein
VNIHKKEYKMIYWLEISSNEVLNSRTFKYALSSISSRSCRLNGGPMGYYIYPETFRSSLALSIAKSLHKSEWYNSSDLYLAPNKDIR